MEQPLNHPYKDSLIGYSIGVGYSPDWGEHTVSLRGDDTSVLKKNMTLHVMLGMWMEERQLIIRTYRVGLNIIFSISAKNNFPAESNQ